MTHLQLKQQFDQEIEKAIQALKKYNPEKIILYGSFVRDDFDKDSDIDLLIIKKGVEKEKPHQRVYNVLKVFNEPLRVEPQVYSPEEIKKLIGWNAWFLKEALEQGKVIYEKK